jgi:hypothetical protein
MAKDVTCRSAFKIISSYVVNDTQHHYIDQKGAIAGVGSTN